MNKKISYALIMCILILSSCSSKPTEADITKKIAIEYVCPESIKLNNLTVSDGKEVKTFAGFSAYEVTVSGDAVWTKDCHEFGTGIPAGYKEKFTNKHLVFVKGEDGWE